MKFALYQNFPNPFNPETWFAYELDEDVEVTINIYNSYGEVIRTLELGNRTAGSYLTKENAAYWDGMNSKGERVSSGLYFYQLKAGDFQAVGRMFIVK